MNKATKQNQARTRPSRRVIVEYLNGKITEQKELQPRAKVRESAGLEKNNYHAKRTRSLYI